jgi:hypothetical protein
MGKDAGMQQLQVDKLVSIHVLRIGRNIAPRYYEGI